MSDPVYDELKEKKRLEEDEAGVPGLWLVVQRDQTRYVCHALVLQPSEAIEVDPETGERFRIPMEAPYIILAGIIESPMPQPEAELIMTVALPWDTIQAIYQLKEKEEDNDAGA